jgi:rhamnulokinase
MTKRFLAFDCGATSCRTVLGTFSDGGFSLEETSRFDNQIIEEGGKYYWDIHSIYSNFVKALSELGREGLKLDSIGIDTWGVDLGYVASDGTLLGLPRAYRDTYTKGAPEEVFRVVPKEEMYGETGIQIMDFNTIFQLYRQKQEKFSPYLLASKALFMPDLLAYLLTGNMVCEYSDASTSALVSQRGREFDYSLMEKLGIRTDLFPKISEAGTVVGPLREPLARETGLGPVKVVAVAGHDTASAVAAVPAENSDFAYLSSGTWSLMGIETESPIMTEASMEANFTNEGGIEGTTRFLKNITGMWLLEQCRKSWAAEGRKYTYPEIEAMAKACSSYRTTVNPDDPRFASPADMDAEIKSDIAGRGLKAPENDGEMVSCIYNSLAKRYSEVVEILQGFAPFKIGTLHVIGGGSANATLCQMTADATSLRVAAGPKEATAIGNIMLQAKAAGLFKDRWEWRHAISEAMPPKIYEPKQNH